MRYFTTTNIEVPLVRRLNSPFESFQRKTRASGLIKYMCKAHNQVQVFVLKAVSFDADFGKENQSMRAVCGTTRVYISSKIYIV